MADSYKISIKKFDSSVDAEPTVVTYEVPDDPAFAPMTALKALNYINRFCEPIAYDFNCRRGTCGRCAMMVDGEACLACQKVLTGEHTIEPLAGFPVIRDLVVDRSAAYQRFVGANSSIKTMGPKDVLKPMEGKKYREEIYPLSACRECMSCYSECMALKDMGLWGAYAGPGAMQAIYLRTVDGEDVSDRIEQAVFSGLFNCVQCGRCSQVCPSGIPCAENIKSMMDQAEERGLKPTAEPTSWWPVA